MAASVCGRCPVSALAFTVHNMDTRRLSSRHLERIITAWMIIFALHCAFNEGVENEKLVSTYLILKSQICNSTYNPCPESDELEKNYLILCELNDRCPDGLAPQCVPFESGSVYICNKKSTCSGGRRKTAHRTTGNTNSITVIEENCPTGFYQEKESSCFDACNNRHLDPKDISPEFKIFKIGDNISPTWIYCNYLDGYFNEDGKFLLDYDREFIHQPFFCNHISKRNPCMGTNLTIFADGRCLPSCKDQTSIREVNSAACVNGISADAWAHLLESKMTTSTSPNQKATSTQEIDLKAENETKNRSSEKKTSVMSVTEILSTILSVISVIAVVLFCVYIVTRLRRRTLERETTNTSITTNAQTVINTGKQSNVTVVVEDNGTDQTTRGQNCTPDSHTNEQSAEETDVKQPLL